MFSLWDGWWWLCCASLWSSVFLKVNFSLYSNGFFLSTLSGLVEFDGYYLESDPCLVCNNPEVPFCVSNIVSMPLLGGRCSGFLGSRDWLLLCRCSSSSVWSPVVQILACHIRYFEQQLHPWVKNGLCWWMLKKAGGAFSPWTNCVFLCALVFSISSCLLSRWTRGIPPPSRLWSSSAVTPLAKWQWKLGTWRGPRWCGPSTCIITTELCRPSWSWKTSMGFADLGWVSRSVRLHTSRWLWFLEGTK